MPIYRLTPKPNTTPVVWKTFTLKRGVGNAVFVSGTEAAIAEAKANPDIYVKQYTVTPTGFTATNI